MYAKISEKLLFCCGIGIILLCSTVNSVKAQQPHKIESVTPESIAEAANLSQQGQAKAEILDYRGAIADLTRAIQLNPHEADHYYQRGLILGQLSDRDSAVADFDDAILRDPHHAWAYLHRGGMSLDLGLGKRITDSSGFNFRLRSRIISDRQGDARAILDLRTARDLFADQGDQEGYQTADLLLKHFAGGLESPTNQRS